MTGRASLADLRGWCNRQHNRFWSCHWGFESSPPSSTAPYRSRRSPAPSSSGLGRRPLKAVTAVRICSGLHTEARLPESEPGSLRVSGDARGHGRARRRSSVTVQVTRVSFRARHRALTCIACARRDPRLRARLRVQVRYPPLRVRAVVPSPASRARACMRVHTMNTSRRREAGITTEQRRFESASWCTRRVRTRGVEMLDGSL